MDHLSEGSESRFMAYVNSLSAAMGHSDRAGPLRTYCTGLLMPGNAGASNCGDSGFLDCGIS
jgi:SRSO17 transposase